MHTKTSFQIIRENILPSENQKEKHRSKNFLYYTEKNSRFVRVFFKNFYTLFTFDFTTAKKYPSIILRKIQVLLMCFQKKFINYFHAKRGLPQTVGQTSSFILFIHQKFKGKYRKSYLQCRSVQGNIPQPFRVTILFSYFSGTIQISLTRR